MHVIRVVLTPDVVHILAALVALPPGPQVIATWIYFQHGLIIDFLVVVQDFFVSILIIRLQGCQIPRRSPRGILRFAPAELTTFRGIRDGLLLSDDKLLQNNIKHRSESSQNRASSPGAWKEQACHFYTSPGASNSCPRMKTLVVRTKNDRSFASDGPCVNNVGESRVDG